MSKERRWSRRYHRQLRAADLRRTRPNKRFLPLYRELSAAGVAFCVEHRCLHYWIDIFLTDYGVAIELDDKLHRKPDAKDYDARRTSMLKTQGGVEVVLRFNYQQLEYDLKTVISRILTYINGSTKKVCRKCMFCVAGSYIVPTSKPKKDKPSKRARGLPPNEWMVVVSKSKGPMTEYTWSRAPKPIDNVLMF